MGNHETTGPRFDQANGVDAILPSAEARSPWP